MSVTKHWQLRLKSRRKRILSAIDILIIVFFSFRLFIQFQFIMPLISIDDNNNCLFFFYFFIGCYIICVTFLIYTLIRLLKYYLTQRRINAISNEIINQRLPTTTTTTVLLKIHNINEQDTLGIKGELDVYQPLIIKTQDLPPIYMENNPNEPPPDYKEYL